MLVPVEMGHGPLVFGTFGHLAMADYYIPGSKRGRHPAETWDEITENFMDAVRTPSTGFLDEDTEMSWEDARQLGHDILVNYVDHYGEDNHIEVLWTEHPGSQKIPHPYKKDESIVDYCYTMDLIVRDHEANGRIRYWDHKFMKAIQTRHLVIDSQNSGYLSVGTHQLRKEGIIGEKEAVRDLVYNFVRKARPPDKPTNRFGEYLNKDGSVSKTQPPPFFDRHVVSKTARERNRAIENIQAEALHMKAFVDKRLPIHKNPTRDCNWDCSFFTLCQVDEVQGNVEETKKALYRVEDPYTEYAANAVSPKRLDRRLAEGA